ncbi:MAG: trypsin-like peptidase domain-containing protein [Clostridia bacterium]|nr:trypsin-like peptidase domain-containing protein [Clostridia bacterium]
MNDNDQLKKNIDDFYSNYTNQNVEVIKNKKEKKNSGRKVLSIIVVVALCLTIGAAGATASIGYFLSVNDVSLKDMLNHNATSTQASVNDNIGSSVNSNETIKQVIVSEQIDNPISAVANKVIPSVVGIRVTFPNIPSFFNMSSTSVGEGSGVIYSSDGYILTNNHVVTEALQVNSNELLTNAKIEVFVNGTETPYDATVVGRSDAMDIALIKINATGLTPADIGNSDNVKIGETAIAIGNPGGIQYANSVTAGIISGVNREISGNSKEQLNLIQTDAAINPGNSGGPLVNIKGEVIGINSIKISDVNFEGLGFAIPINSIIALVEPLKDTGYIATGTPNIGISIDQTFDETAASSNNLPQGVLVATVYANTPAEEAGVQVYDIITEFNGVKVTNFDQLVAEKNKYAPGDVVTIKVYRLFNKIGNYIDLQLTLGETKQ